MQLKWFHADEWSGRANIYLTMSSVVIKGDRLSSQVHVVSNERYAKKQLVSLDDVEANSQLPGDFGATL